MILKFITILTLATASLHANTDYCDSKLCDGANHVACDHKERFYPNCPKNVEMIPMTSEIKDHILNEHNTVRNLVASGKHDRDFKKASRMCRLQWCPTLEYLASLNAMKCKKEHDKCMSDPHFAYVGQNLYSGNSSPNPPCPLTVVTKGVDKWHEEAKKTSQENLDELGKKKGIGHFTQIVSDRTCYVGCAMTMWSKGKKNFFYLVCDYSFTNLVGTPAYATKGRKCKTGYDSDFPYLCSSDEAEIINNENLENKN